MNPFKFLIVTVLLISATAHVKVFAQCSNRVELTKVSPGVSGANNGTIDVKITTGRTYQVKLIQLDNASEKVISRKQGNRTGTITFTNLSEDSLYKVIVDFVGEEKFLCQTKVVSDIVLTTRGN